MNILLKCYFNILKITEIYFNSPIYTAMNVLDQSKTLIFDFYYNTENKKYGNNSSLYCTRSY